MINNKFRIIFLGTVFLAIISFPIINDEFKLVKDIESSENRKMAAKPVINYTYLDPYPVQYEKFYNDNFSIRSLMVKYFNLLNIEFFKKSPVPDKVVIGRDNWLFMADKELNSYQGLNRFNESELEAFRQELEYRKTYLEARGCKLYFLVAPIKANIYSEYMPASIFQVNKQSWGEQLIEYLDNNCAVKPVNVYDVLRANKDKELVYFMLDNHWNELGAFYCASEFFRRLHDDIPGISVPSIDDYNISKTEINTGNIVSMLSNIGNYSDFSIKLEPKSGFMAKDVKPAGYPVIPGFPYPWEYEMDKEIPGLSKPKILIITDSYGVNIFPFIAEGFGRSVKIFDAWQYKLNEDIVASEKPDVVLVIALESNLRSMLKYRATLNPTN
jgi:alginate O-acetyltransferase complex protein AlgJ